jgi:hypothetical protein
MAGGRVVILDGHGVIACNQRNLFSVQVWPPSWLMSMCFVEVYCYWCPKVIWAVNYQRLDKQHFGLR